MQTFSGASFSLAHQQSRALTSVCCCIVCLSSLSLAPSSISLRIVTSSSLSVSVCLSCLPTHCHHCVVALSHWLVASVPRQHSRSVRLPVCLHVFAVCVSVFVSSLTITVYHWLQLGHLIALVVPLAPSYRSVSSQSGTVLICLSRISIEWHTDSASTALRDHQLRSLWPIVCIVKFAVAAAQVHFLLLSLAGKAKKTTLVETALPSLLHFHSCERFNVITNACNDLGPVKGRREKANSSAPLIN